MSTSNDRFLQETLEFWQHRTNRKLSLEDAREITKNMIDFFESLVGQDALPRPNSEEARDHD